MPDAKRAVLIAGPTASGKSALALELAERLGGTIINADSMQVYAGLRVITARPSPEEEARAPHVMYGHVDAGEIYSTGRWLDDIAGALKAAAAAGRVPIVVGGTGLYFKVLTEGLASVPVIPPEIRAQVRDKLESEGVSALYADLIKHDPVTAARLMPLDRARIARALEVVLATGRSLSDWHGEPLPPLLDASQAAKVFIETDRKDLVARIDRRFHAMLDEGALEEVRALAARQLNPLLPAMKAHGVPWLIRHLNGELTLNEATEGGIMDTRRYAKRQLTWFRGQMKNWESAKPADAVAIVLRAFAARK
jgi:tRNA dimethylallyltransferase